MKMTTIALGVNERINSRLLPWAPPFNSQWETLGADTEDQFISKLKKCKKTKDILPRQYEEMLFYKENPITYQINNYGYRGDNLNPEDEHTVFLGCSHTFGTGHYFENSWPYRMMNYLNDGTKMANFAFGGEGISSGYRTLLKMSEEIKIKRVFCFYPHWMRYDFGGGPPWNKWQTFTPYDQKNQLIEEWGEKGSKSIINHMIDFDHSYHYYNSNLLAILALTQGIGAELYTTSYFDPKYREMPNYTPLYYARDYHPSTWVQNGIFKMFKELVDNKQIANIQYIKENLSTREHGDSVLMDNNEEGILMTPPFSEHPTFARPGNEYNPEDHPKLIIKNPLI